MKIGFVLGVFSMFFLLSTAQLFAQTGTNEVWKAPEESAGLKNKFTSKEDMDAGKKMFDMYCWVCHGKEGRGDGPSAATMSVPPRNFTDEEVSEQTDGALFWKLSNGRGNMIGYQNILPEEKRWQLITYIRHINESAAKNDTN